MISQKEFDDAMADLVAAEAEIERLRAALEPLARISLWRDRYPDGPDILNDRMLSGIITVAEVRAAREALDGQLTQDGKDD